MDNKQINKILQDVYAVDKNLQKHEDKLKKIIKQLLESRPNTKFDKDFVRRLRTELMARAAELKNQPQTSLINLISNFMKGIIMPARGGSPPAVPGHWRAGAWGGKRAYYMVGVAVFIALLIIPTMYYINKSDKLAELAKTKLAFKPSITKVADKAFGSIYTESAMPGQADGRGAGGGGGMPESQVTLEAERMATGIARVPAPQVINFNYIYKGDEFFLDQEQLPVYKRIKSSSVGKDLAQNMAKTNLGLVDLSKFQNTELTNFNITEEQEFGYGINFNLREGLISINANWNKWPRPDKDCRDQACFEQFRLKIEDVPTDEKLIAIADQFIQQYGIDMTNYEQGEVLDYWKTNYERASDKSLAYVPDTIPVVYPLVIDNQTVYDQSGNKTGITIEVNIRHNKAAGLHSITAQNYQSSNYEAETDSKEIIALAENGGMFRGYASPNPTKTIDIELGTPTLTLVKIWQYDQDKGKGTELYVPSLIFPVTSVSDQTYFKQNNIVVPLIKEVLKERKDNIIGAPVVPAPVVEE